MKTLILGATPNPTRYAFMAAEKLSTKGLEFIPIGIKEGEVFGQKILNLRERPEISDVHTVTLYIGAANQGEWIGYILQLNPKRIIFNPGTENKDFASQAKALGIEVIYGCTLVMLGNGLY